MILNPDLDLTLRPMKYPQFFQLYKDSLKNIWTTDELDFSIPLDKAEKYATIAKMTFEEPIPELNGVSLPASAVYGANWAAAH